MPLSGRAWSVNGIKKAPQRVEWRGERFFPGESGLHFLLFIGIADAEFLASMKNGG